MELITRQQAVAANLPKYFTGKVCRRGHIAERYLAGACTACVSERKAELYVQNRTAVLAYMRVQGARYRANNPEKRAENSRKWRSENREHANALSRARYANDSTAHKQAARKHFSTHREQERERTKRWRAQNIGLVNQYTGQRRAARLQRTPLWLTADEHWMIEQAYELAAMRTEQFGFPWHVDHVIPLRGKLASGLHTPYNLQVIPAVDNLRKSNRMELA